MDRFDTDSTRGKKTSKFFLKISNVNLNSILRFYELLRGVRWFETEVSGPIDSLETSVSDHLTPYNDPEDGRMQFNRGGSVSRTLLNLA